MRIEDKKEKKEEIAQKNAEKLKTMIERSFDRRDQGVREVKSEFSKKLREIEVKDVKKAKFADGFQKHYQKTIQEKIQKNSDRKQDQTVNYEKALDNYEQFKERVLQKHFRLSRVAEDIKYHRQELSTIKRRNNLEVNMARTAFTSNSPMKRREIKSLRVTF